MKTNIILSIMLIIQVLAFCLTGTRADLDRSLALRLSAEAALDPELDGLGLQRRLDLMNIKISESQEQLGIPSELLKRALQSSRVDSALITRVEIETAARDLHKVRFTRRLPQGEERSITLTRGSGADHHDWSLSEAHGYPADPRKVSVLLKRLLSLKLNTVVARKTTNHARLRVSASAYDRALTISTRQGDLTLYLGQSPRGMIHLRFAEEDQVYRVRGLSLNRDLKLEPPHFLSRSYLKSTDTRTVEVSGPGERRVELRRYTQGGETRWAVKGVSSEELDQGRAQRFVNAAQELILRGVAGQRADVRYGLETGVLIKLRGAEGVLSYRVSQGAAQSLASTQVQAQNLPKRTKNKVSDKHKDEVYYAQRVDSPYIIEIDAHRVKPLVTQSIDDFLSEPAREARRGAAQEKVVPAAPETIGEGETRGAHITTPSPSSTE